VTVVFLLLESCKYTGYSCIFTALMIEYTKNIFHFHGNGDTILSILENIRGRDDLVKLNKQETEALCQEIRDFLVRHVSDSGGHLASNLGIVEATIAVHREN